MHSMFLSYLRRLVGGGLNKEKKTLNRDPNVKLRTLGSLLMC